MFKRILITVELPPGEALHSKALAVAADLAREADADLIVGTVLPEWITVRDADWDPAAEQEFTRKAEEDLDGIVAGLPHPKCEKLVHWGAKPGATLDLIDAARADLLVLPHRRRGLLDFVRPSDTMRIARRSSCSVLLVRE